MGINQMLMKLAEGMATSCWIFGITLLFSLPLGMVIAFGRMSKKRIVQGITKIYISIMRGTPLMLLSISDRIICSESKFHRFTETLRW